MTSTAGQTSTDRGNQLNKTDKISFCSIVLRKYSAAHCTAAALTCIVNKEKSRRCLSIVLLLHVHKIISFCDSVQQLPATSGLTQVFGINLSPGLYSQDVTHPNLRRVSKIFWIKILCWFNIFLFRKSSPHILRVNLCLIYKTCLMNNDFCLGA